MHNRNQSQGQNPHDYPIFVYNPATPVRPLEVNNNIRIILCPIANNQQVGPQDRLRHASMMPLPVEIWQSATTLPTDPTSATVLYADSPALQELSEMKA